ncbi:MAG: DUF4252 domain-containing protein [Saprospiraceae bacterium]|nr:DUF4252 domain-containing protein [Saprospiraceae bacterium]
MKQLMIALITMLFLSQWTFAQKNGTLEKYYKQHKNNENIMFISLNGGMFKDMLGDFKMDADIDKEIKELLKDFEIDHMKILTIEEDTQQHYTQLKKILSGHHTLMNIKESEDHVEILGKEMDKKMQEFVLLVKEENELVLISLSSK